jgi:hypothetical protein
MGAKFWLIASGLALILSGVLIRWRTARYDLKDAAIDSAWTLVRRRRTAENPTALETVFNDISSQPTWTGKAGKAAQTAIGHYAAQILAVVALVLVVAGLGLALLGLFWRWS